MIYLLPTHPSLSCADPLGICDLDDPTQADVLQQLIRAARVHVARHLQSPGSSVLPALIEDIAYSIHGNGSLDTSYLRQFLRTKWTNERAVAIQNLLKSALLLPSLFDTNSLSTLDGSDTSPAILSSSSSIPSISRFTGPQVDALLAHQFLGSLSQPPGNTWGLPCFTSWFLGDPAHGKAVDGYLSTILEHFEHGYEERAIFSFMMHKADRMPEPSQCDATPDLRLVVVSEESESFSPDAEMEPSPFILVAAHSQPGPGPTGTHEERLQSASPALSISALVTPCIPSDAAVITSAFPVHAAWNGHNRTARLEALIPPIKRPSRHYILADALPLDETEEVASSGLKDLQSGRMLREIRKLFAAFEGAKLLQSRIDHKLPAPCIVNAVAWGCQAFGGNLLAKFVCMMIAAGLSGITVQIMLLENRAVDIEAVKTILSKNLPVAKLWAKIDSPDIRSCRNTAELKDFMLSH